MYTSFSARGSAVYRDVDLKSQVMSASPHGLVALLFKELRTCVVGAKSAMERKDVSTKVRLIGKATRLLDEGLMTSLDLNTGGELAANLYRLYSYCLVLLGQANASNNPALLDEVTSLLEPVMSGWQDMGTLNAG